MFPCNYFGATCEGGSVVSGTTIAEGFEVEMNETCFDVEIDDVPLDVEIDDTSIDVEINDDELIVEIC